ncbi:glycerate kinase type-2 family protein [Roseitranquillus sediminis]|uniref:glycerate kinase type-2 family protein n=1 Tax=Roseitranquillus sediminis TaxID=2809051 RepID=UPI001D0C0676|nr:glycerate kinase [Roseitranquillus sediminis]MBM9595668.1 glycerate kinase [Roseitranquillus sediminis]
MERRDFLRRLFDTAVAAADPMRIIPEALPERPDRVTVIGAGKASARMAEAVESAWGPCPGLVITRYGHARPCEGIEVVEAGHPTPDEAGVEVTQRILRLVRKLGDGDTLLALISGGGSALLCAPAPGITLTDKQEVSAALMAAGAPIGELNAVRKQLSAVKGGRLAAAAWPARVLTLMISDVPGDAAGDIASGPTVGEPGSAAGALEILRRRGVEIPERVEALLGGGTTTVPPGDARLLRTENRVVAEPGRSLAAAAEQARAEGVEPVDLGDTLEGEARELAVRQVREALDRQRRMASGDRPQVLLSGGECTVTGRGDGSGGPNAEFALAAALEIGGRGGIHVLACDTDGVDGAAEIAGAVAGPDTLERARAAGRDPEDALRRHDSHGFFAAIGGGVVTGPTLTNVNDFRAILVEPAA